MNVVTVVIMHGPPCAWYEDLVGEQFCVYDNGRDFIVKEDYDRGSQYPWCHIDKRDCATVIPTTEGIQE